MTPSAETVLKRNDRRVCNFCDRVSLNLDSEDRGLNEKSIYFFNSSRPSDAYVRQ